MIQAMGLAKAEPRKPKAGTRKMAASVRAIISITPARMARNTAPL